MPRYYFHLTGGKQVLNNHKGIDLSGNAAAPSACILHARRVAKEGDSHLGNSNVLR
jgi:hypothetical protein